MRIMVTGGAEFIGSHIVEQLLSAGHEVAVKRLRLIFRYPFGNR
jgi:nucleoside-diphosphate-sugar epimerase